LETALVFEREDVRERRERSDSAHLCARFGIGISILRKALDLAVETTDARGELLNQRQQRLTQAGPK
jgi:hypothetical protein